MASEMSSLSKSVAVLISKFDGLNSQLSVAVNAIQTTQAQLSLTTSKLDTVVNRLSSVESKLEIVTQDYTSFKSKMDTTYSLMKWLGAFAAGTLITLIISGSMIARSAGNMEATIQHQQTTLNELKEIAREQRAKQNP